MKRLLFCCLLLLASVARPAIIHAERYSPRVGERHVPFTLPSIEDGKPISLSQYKGKKVLLIQFASW